MRRFALILNRPPCASLNSRRVCLTWSAPSTIERNLSIEKRWPRRPMRDWANSTGPRLSSLTVIVSISSGGPRTISPIAAPSTSIVRLRQSEDRDRPNCPTPSSQVWSISLNEPGTGTVLSAPSGLGVALTGASRARSISHR